MKEEKKTEDIQCKRELWDVKQKSFMQISWNSNNIIIAYYSDELDKTYLSDYWIKENFNWEIVLKRKWTWSWLDGNPFGLDSYKSDF